MGKILKGALSVAGGLLVLAIGGTVVKYFVLLPKSNAAPDVHAPNTPEAIARGKYLASSVAVCDACHAKLDESKASRPMVDGMTGSGRVFTEIGLPGTIRAQNLTSDKRDGIGAWTDGEVLRAMREGIGRDGRPLFPLMPYRTLGAHLSDDDALAIIAYLRTLPPIANAVPPSELDFPVSMFLRGIPKPVETPAAAEPSDPLQRGKWLLSVANCAACHDTTDSRHRTVPGMAFAGGAPFEFAGGKVYASNLTSDKETGIGSYTDEDLMRALDEGINKAGRPIFQMPWTFYKTMTTDDKKALVMALRAVPAVQHAVPAAAIR